MTCASYGGGSVDVTVLAIGQWGESIGQGEAVGKGRRGGEGGTAAGKGAGGSAACGGVGELRVRGVEEGVCYG